MKFAALIVVLILQLINSSASNVCIIHTNTQLLGSTADSQNATIAAGVLDNAARVFNSTNKSIQFQANINSTAIQSKSCADLNKVNITSQLQLITLLSDPCRYDRLQRAVDANCTIGLKQSPTAVCPLQVTIRIIIYSLDILRANDLKLQTLGLIQLQFNDTRLAFDRYTTKFKKPIIFGDDIGSKLWLPKLTLANHGASSSVDEGSKSISVSADGSVLISLRFSAAYDCYTFFQKFPLDEQYCSTTFQSVIYSTNEVFFDWADNRPIVFHPTQNITSFNLNDYFPTQSIQIANANDSLSDDYNSLSLILILSRNFSFYVIAYFGPSIMIVANSWVAFWLQPDQTPARTVLGTSTLLCLITLTSTKFNTMPNSYYMKISEIWFFVCALFIFSSLTEFAFVNSMWRRKHAFTIKRIRVTRWFKVQALKRRKSIFPKIGEMARKLSNMDASVLNCPAASIEMRAIDDRDIGKEKQKVDKEKDASVSIPPHEAALWIDRRARFYFPLAFILFNAIFWTLVFTL